MQVEEIIPWALEAIVRQLFESDDQVAVGVVEVLVSFSCKAKFCVLTVAWTNEDRLSSFDLIDGS